MRNWIDLPPLQLSFIKQINRPLIGLLVILLSHDERADTKLRDSVAVNRPSESDGSSLHIIE